MNQRGNPNIATIKPFQPGNRAPRRSRHTDRAIRLFRALTPEAAEYAAKVLRDEAEDTRHRIKAAEIILQHGMPKGDAHNRALEGISSLKVEFVAADGSLVTFQQDAPPSQPAIVEVPFETIDEVAVCDDDALS